MGRLVDLIQIHGHRPAFWKWLLFSRIAKRPFWYSDKYGVTLRIYQEDDFLTVVTRGMLFDDGGVLVLLSRLLKSGMLVFDVGANYGQFSIYAAKLVGPEGKIHAFEPAGYSYHRLEENVRRMGAGHGDIHLNQIAVGHSGGKVVFHEFAPKYSAWNSLGEYKMDGPDGVLVPGVTEMVEQIRLDDYCLRNQIERVDLLKVDVEGFEEEVIEGASQSIRSGLIRQILFEISLAPLNGLGRKPRDVVERLTDLGFAVKLIRTDGMLSEVAPRDFDFPFFANYLATRDRGGK